MSDDVWLYANYYILMLKYSFTDILEFLWQWLIYVEWIVDFILEVCASEVGLVVRKYAIKFN